MPPLMESHALLQGKQPPLGTSNLVMQDCYGQSLIFKSEPRDLKLYLKYPDFLRSVWFKITTLSEHNKPICRLPRATGHNLRSQPHSGTLAPQRLRCHPLKEGQSRDARSQQACVSIQLWLLLVHNIEEVISSL